MQLLTVILHYGNPAMSTELCRMLQEANPKRSADVRILDNAAPLPVADPWHREPENRFWAGALEHCLELAAQEGFSHLWFLNNDIRFLRTPNLDGIEARLSRVQQVLNTSIGLWSPSIAVNPYHPQMCPSRIAMPRTLRTVRLVDCVAPLLCLDAVQATGGLDAADNPKGYGVDLWLSMRLADKGFAVLVDQEITVRHRAHGTAKKIPGFMEQAAMDEAQFCAARLGPCWQERLEAMKLEDADPSHLISF